MKPPIQLYDLAGAEDDRLFSPYCWRVRMALLHKGLAIKTIPWRFSEKEAIAFSGQGKVPVIVDGDREIHDSWQIALYLEENYPDLPSLFGGAAGKAQARFITIWAEKVLYGNVMRMVVLDVYNHLQERDQSYFRQRWEGILGMKLEEVVADREARREALLKDLSPLRDTLEEQPFLGGDHPLWADYAVFGAFQWALVISPFQLLPTADRVYAWRQKMLDLFAGAPRLVSAYFN